MLWSVLSLCQSTARTRLTGRESCWLEKHFASGTNLSRKSLRWGTRFRGSPAAIGWWYPFLLLAVHAKFPAQLSRRMYHCATKSAYGFGMFGDRGGAASDLIRVPFADAMMIKLPDSVSAADSLGPLRYPQTPKSKDYSLTLCGSHHHRRSCGLITANIRQWVAAGLEFD